MARSWKKANSAAAAGELYARLGVRAGAGVAEIRRAYQKLARQYHPDLNPGDAVAVERFEQISQAWLVLSDPARRAAYDRGDAPAVAVEAEPEVGFEGFDFSAESGVPAGFREIFAGVLRGPDAAERGAEPGEDIEQRTRVSFEESFHGTQRRVHLVRQDHCPACGGRGDTEMEPIACPRCRGTGSVRAGRRHLVFTRGCPDCLGRGVLDRRTCSRCSGEGRLMQSEWLELHIPPGVGDGSQVRLTGCGNAGRRGGPPGDFVLVVDVEAHPFYRREGDDLHCVVPLTITEAALGGHVEVPTPDGSVRIEVPAGTQGGHRFRLRKRGVPRLDGKGRGDLYVEATIWVPTVTEGRPRELLEELRSLGSHDPRAALLEGRFEEEGD